ncbi:MAG: hypothetical protein RL383_1341 [Actinomycetota bacterium]
MRLRLALGFTVVGALIVIVFSVPLASYVSRVERDRLVTALERDAFILAGHAASSLAGDTITSLDPYVAEFDAASDARAVVTDADGRLIATNDPGETVGTNFVNRPEVAAALEGSPAEGERESVTLGEVLVYVAVPVLSGDTVVGSVRLSYPKSVVDSKVRARIMGVVGAGGIALISAVIVAVLVGSALARPITRLREVTDDLSRGNFSSTADETNGPPEVRELARGFNEMSRRLSLMIRGQRQFAGDVSHQLRTPLTALRLRLEQAESDSASGRPVGAALEAAVAETDRLSALVEQLLALARLEGASAPRERVDASAAVEARCEMWAPLAEEMDIRLVVTTDGAGGCLVVPGGIEQVIDNYLDNAVSVSPRGSSIEVAVRRDGGWVEVSVSDSGPGLTDEQRERAFERFWRGPASTGESGSGLGLAVVRQIATASGGHVRLDAAESGGVRAVAQFVAA